MGAVINNLCSFGLSKKKKMKTFDYPTQKNLPLVSIDFSVFEKSKAEKELVKGFKKLIGKTKNHKFKTIVKGSY